MFHKKTRLLLYILLVIANLSVSPTILAKVNIESESTRIELNNRLDRCRSKGFVVSDEPTTEYALRNLVKKCELELKISYPKRENLLNRLNLCIEKGYKEQKLPTRITLVDLNDLVAGCENKLGINSNSNNIAVGIVLFFIFFVFLIAIISSSSDQTYKSNYIETTPDTDALTLKINQQNLVEETLLQIDQMLESEFKKFLSTVYYKFNYAFKLIDSSSNSSIKLVITSPDNSQSIVIQVLIFNSEVNQELTERNAIREAYTDIRLCNADCAYVFYNSYFTFLAKEEAKQLELVLYDRDSLKNLIFSYLFE